MRRRAFFKLPMRMHVSEDGPMSAVYEQQKTAAEARETEFDDYPDEFRAVVNAIGLKNNADIALAYRLYKQRITDHGQLEQIKADEAWRQREEMEEAFG